MMGGVAMGYTSQALLRHTWEKGEGVVELGSLLLEIQAPHFLSFVESSVFSLFVVFLFFGSVGDAIVHEWLIVIRIVVTRLPRGE